VINSAVWLPSGVTLKQNVGIFAARHTAPSRFDLFSMQWHDSQHSVTHGSLGNRVLNSQGRIFHCRCGWGKELGGFADPVTAALGRIVLLVESRFPGSWLLLLACLRVPPFTPLCLANQSYREAIGTIN
jgi:hypothetical protein